MENFNLTTNTWTEKDFSEMDWHDCTVYAIAFGNSKFELLFDIDYILKWINPEKDEKNYKFLIVPSIVIFRNVYEINFDLASVDFQILEINRSNPKMPKNAEYINEDTEYDWNILTTNGAIIFKSVGYTQIARSNPVLSESQTLGVNGRGGLNWGHYL
jgi:hypothetical protein